MKLKTMENMRIHRQILLMYLQKAFFFLFRQYRKYGLDAAKQRGICIDTEGYSHIGEYEGSETHLWYTRDRQGQNKRCAEKIYFFLEKPL